MKLFGINGCVGPVLRLTLYSETSLKLTMVNFSRKLDPDTSEQHQMCSDANHADKVICCGVKIDFYEDCGHTLTLADHHRSCVHHNKEENFPYERYGRLLTSSSPPQYHISMAPKPGSHLPFPQPRCKDFHRYITLIPGKCGCTYPERHDSCPATSSIPERSERTQLCASAILKRRIYWLQQQSLDTQNLASIRLSEWSARLRKHQQQEEAMAKPVIDRTFMYDPDTGANLFLAAVEIAFLTRTQGTCIICKKAASNQHSRKLPCGCVFDIGCLKSWFLGRKDCPLCRKMFHLVKKITPYEAGHGSPVWEDDDYSGFV
ncbi:hypothetical protein WAI453_010027 [Rhynchosporium graminicola]|uniref:RING-type domain-containing protein n=1 Tax=Rhynchosporium graminicola TaxID=2792576 RepID=A0A1E1KEZ9_9HELO|nr:uncharacterized protein RCO7_04822 [Rhynchosporium commune]